MILPMITSIITPILVHGHTHTPQCAGANPDNPRSTPNIVAPAIAPIQKAISISIRIGSGPVIVITSPATGTYPSGAFDNHTAVLPMGSFLVVVPSHSHRYSAKRVLIIFVVGSPC